MPAICPKCNNDDMSKKVKAVYSGVVSQWPIVCSWLLRWNHTGIKSKQWGFIANA